MRLSAMLTPSIHPHDFLKTPYIGRCEGGKTAGLGGTGLGSAGGGAARERRGAHRLDKKELLRTWPGPAGLRHHRQDVGEQVHELDPVHAGTSTLFGPVLIGDRPDGDVAVDVGGTCSECGGVHEVVLEHPLEVGVPLQGGHIRVGASARGFDGQVPGVDVAACVGAGQIPPCSERVVVGEEWVAGTAIRLSP